MNRSVRTCALFAMMACALAAGAACSAPEPLELADWTIPVAEGARIIESAHVPIEERTDRIELVEDLLIGGGAGDDPNYSFYRAWGIAVDARGNMYVLEHGNKRVQVFDPEGQYLRTLGSEGQGPGEFQEPTAIGVAGDTVFVIDPVNGRVNHWSIDGEYIGAPPLEHRSLDAVGLADGTLVGSFVIFHREPEFYRERVFSRFSRDGNELQRYTIFRARSESSIAVPYNTPRVVASAAGDVYVTRARQHQIHAFNADGTPRWALRTTWPTPEVPQSVFDDAIERLRERQPDYQPPDTWLEHMPAIGNLAVDGQGNVYVFAYQFIPRDPYTAEPLAEVPGEIAVDVYSPDGEHLAAAMTRVGGWSAAWGDYVYSMGRDPDTEEEVLRRSRLVVPWEQ